jgi:hypothetical protein
MGEVLRWPDSQSLLGELTAQLREARAAASAALIDYRARLAPLK